MDAVRAVGALPMASLAILAKAAESAFFLDVDGTLLEIAARPADVVADEALRRLLAVLRAETGGALALVSGRRIDDIDRIFFPLRLPCAGLHGAEIRFADGARTEACRIDGPAMERARLSCRDFAAAHPGVILEDKGAALAVHFRQRPELAGQVHDLVGDLARDGLVVQAGKMVAELKDARATKAKAIEVFSETPPFTGRKPVFVGDDLTDESGFRFVNDRGGISIRVGLPEIPTEARYCLRDPAHLRDELDRLVVPASSERSRAMPAAVTQFAEGFPRRAFTVDEILRMQEAGIIGEDENFELIEGEIVPMQAKTHIHELIKSALTLRLARALPDNLWLGIESTMYLSERTLLEPDLVVYRRGLKLEEVKGPDILLAIEVALTSLAFDRGLKAKLYARYGVRELWVIDAARRQTFVHTEPTETGWTRIVETEPEAVLACAAVPGFEIRLVEI